MPKKHRQLTQAQLADYNQLCHDRTYGRLLIPDGIRSICEANNFDTDAIGRHFLEVLPRICPEHAGRVPDVTTDKYGGTK